LPEFSVAGFQRLRHQCKKLPFHQIDPLVGQCLQEIWSFLDLLDHKGKKQDLTLLHMALNVAPQNLDHQLTCNTAKAFSSAFQLLKMQVGRMLARSNCDATFALGRLWKSRTRTDSDNKLSNHHHHCHGQQHHQRHHRTSDLACH
jgi:hypothetical protein